MSETHTAGPWEVVRVEDVLAIMPDPITGRPDSFLGIAIVQEHDGERSKQGIEANARLIAAAPDLLEALKGFLEPLDSDGDFAAIYRDKVRAARAAISRATQAPQAEEGGR